MKFPRLRFRAISPQMTIQAHNGYELENARRSHFEQGLNRHDKVHPSVRNRYSLVHHHKWQQFGNKRSDIRAIYEVVRLQRIFMTLIDKFSNGWKCVKISVP